MDSQKGFVRTFTVEEANRLLPFLEAALHRIAGLKMRMKQLDRDMETLYEIWGEELLQETNIDNKLYKQSMEKKQAAALSIRAEIGAINTHGCIVKDLDKGLVDFYYDNKGELVFLCWKRGEARVTHWHPLSSGSVSRRPLEELAVKG